MPQCSFCHNIALQLSETVINDLAHLLQQPEEKSGPARGKAVSAVVVCVCACGVCMQVCVRAHTCVCVCIHICVYISVLVKGIGKYLRIQSVNYPLLFIEKHFFE